MFLHTDIAIDPKALELSDSAFHFSTLSSIEGFPWWVTPLQGKDFLQLCKYIHQQQPYVMPLLDLMTSNNPKMDWYNILYLNYGHNVTFNFD